MLGNILSKFDQNLKSCLPTNFDDDKYNPTQSSTNHDYPYFCFHFFEFVIDFFCAYMYYFCKIYMCKNYSKCPDTAPLSTLILLKIISLFKYSIYKTERLIFYNYHHQTYKIIIRRTIKLQYIEGLICNLASHDDKKCFCSILF